MQGDLISRKELIKVLSEKYSGLSDAREEYDFAMYTAFKQIVRVIEEQPTAYDVEKVVAELEDRTDFAKNFFTTSKVIHINTASKYIRNGGKE